MEKILKISFGCHQIPHRSFFYKEKQFPLCARCTGILIGYMVGVVCTMIWGYLSINLSLMLIIPLVIDGGIQYVTKKESTNNRRLLTGILTGVGTVFILCGIMVLGMSHGKYIVQYLIT